MCIKHLCFNSKIFVLKKHQIIWLLYQLFLKHFGYFRLPVLDTNPNRSKFGQWLSYSYLAKLQLSGKEVVKVRCSGCEQICVKPTTNNLIKCYACSRQFCFLCGKRINGITEKKRHFKEDCALHSESTTPFLCGQVSQREKKKCLSAV